MDFQRTTEMIPQLPPLAMDGLEEKENILGSAFLTIFPISTLYARSENVLGKWSNLDPIHGWLP